MDRAGAVILRIMDRAGAVVPRITGYHWLGQLMEEPMEVEWLEQVRGQPPPPQHEPHNVVALGLHRLATKH